MTLTVGPDLTHKTLPSIAQCVSPKGGTSFGYACPGCISQLLLCPEVATQVDGRCV